MLTAKRDTSRTGDESSGAGKSDSRARPLRRRRSLPGSRAVVGGFLIAAAAVGIFAAYTNASTDHRVDYVVAQRPLTVGQHVTAEDLATAPMQLPSNLSDQFAYRDPARLIGAVVTSPVRAGELVQASDVAAGEGGLGQRQVSFPVDASRAVDGTLAVGDSVDVLATYGSGPDASTMAVAIDVRVIALSASSPSLGGTSGRSEVVTVALKSWPDVLALTQAVNAGQVLLARSTGATMPIGPTAYKTPVPVGTAGPNG
ncbi:MAG: hypothetical protein DLM54_05150 [Acidimicrobiales bacterium]|nr:MAG: hypothetical protein DLM54_05150 [Acidimicrobiales bacterium]